MTNRCLKCIYCVGISVGTATCDYLLITGKRRPCDPDSKDSKCTAYIQRKRIAKNRMKKDN